MALRFPYRRGDGFDVSTHEGQIRRYAVFAIQQELHSYHAKNIKADGLFGPATERVVKTWQIDHKLVGDGLVGPKTAKLLFSPHIHVEEQAKGIVGPYLQGMVRWEANFDPGATGPNDVDSGLVQINLGVHTDISEAQAFDPIFSIDYGARRMASAYQSFQSSPMAWQCAIAQHNSPKKAKQWYTTGQAPDDKIALYVERIMSYQP